MTQKSGNTFCSKKQSSDNSRLVSKLLFAIFLMICLTYASVPLYSIFCKVTGSGGTVREYRNFDNIRVGKKIINVRFNADIELDLPLLFKAPAINHVTVKTGQNKLIFYSAENISDNPIDIIAVYNVTPHKAGKYFNKVACFCFNRQKLEPHQKMAMPVSFFIDPQIEDDSDTQEISTMTLSYTFFRYREST